MKKILLIRPPERYLPHRLKPMMYFPLGLLQIAAVLIEKGIEVEIIDGIMPESDIKEGDNFFGITLSEIKNRIKKHNFDIVGISAQFTFQWPNVLKTARLCREINPQCKIVCGGAHVSVQFEKILEKYDCIDIVVRGEGELVMEQLVQKIRKGLPLTNISGVAYRNENGQISRTETVYIDDLDTLPYPAYDLIDLEKYFHLMKNYSTRTSFEFPGSHRGMTLITSRGCPFQCVFCSIHLHMGNIWRGHSKEYVLGYIEHLIKNYDIRYLHFEDDNSSFDPERFGAILDGISDNGWNVRWDTPNGVRADTFDEELLFKCKKSGCTHLVFGIESGVQRILNEIIHKGITINKIEQTMHLARKIGVDSRAFFMIGLPGETKIDIKKTADYVLKIMWRYECFGGIGMAVPLLGTKLYDICEKGGYFTSQPTLENLSNGFLNAGMIKTDSFGPKDLEKIRKAMNQKQTFLLLIIFIRKLIFNQWLIGYVFKYLLVTPLKGWSAVYYKVLFFQNALEFDLKKGNR